MHEPQTAEAPLRRAEAADVGEEELPRVADDHVLDLTAPMNERADLPPRLPRRIAERLRQLARRDL
jgi:hypothetical protein